MALASVFIASGAMKNAEGFFEKTFKLGIFNVYY